VGGLVLRLIQRNAGPVAITVGVLVIRGLVSQRRVRHVADRERHACDVLGNPGLGNRALAARARRARARAAGTPGAAHRGAGHPIMDAVLDGDRHDRCPSVSLFRARAVQVAYVHIRKRLAGRDIRSLRGCGAAVVRDGQPDGIGASSISVTYRRTGTSRSVPEAPRVARDRPVGVRRGGPVEVARESGCTRTRMKRPADYCWYRCR
jgi:hypothetical protein